MNKTERIAALSWLGRQIQTDSGWENVLERARQKNGFFTPEFSKISLQAIGTWLEEKVLSDWLTNFPENPNPKQIGLILAGNIPLVGWHDLMAVFATGHISVYKPSQSDDVLIGHLIGLLVEKYPEAGPYFIKAERLNDVDALIATGSKATAAHFDYYFRTKPRLIRGSRSSLGFIYGFETEEELSLLCDDVMQYYGMGCRSVSKLLVPEDYDFEPFYKALEKYRYLTDHHKFQNNAIYHKSIFLMNGDSFLDNDILMLRHEKSLFTPPAVVNYEVYKTLDEAKSMVDGHRSELQCLVSHQGQFPGSIPFGTAQKPAIDDYADGVNTLDFLRELL
jgi:hypothetical protein